MATGKRDRLLEREIAAAAAAAGISKAEARRQIEARVAGVPYVPLNAHDANAAKPKRKKRPKRRK